MEISVRIPQVDICPRCGSPTTLHDDGIRACTKCRWATQKKEVRHVDIVTGKFRFCRRCGSYIPAGRNAERGYCINCKNLDKTLAKK